MIAPPRTTAARPCRHGTEPSLKLGLPQTHDRFDAPPLRVG
jgi:hypothetical protein